MRPLWHVGAGKALFTGVLNHNSPHAHSVSVFLTGIYDTFQLRLTGGEWQACRTAVIPAGTAYEFDAGGNPLGVFYLEPNIGGADRLVPLVGTAEEKNGAVISKKGGVNIIRELYEDCFSRDWVELALDDLLNFSGTLSRKEIDPRISRAVERIAVKHGNVPRIASIARFAGLSVSRFQHLFRKEVGVPFRRYRGWQRLRLAIEEVIKGNNFTHSAHAAGFYDQAHFSHDFRRTFGAPASESLKTIRL